MTLKEMAKHKYYKEVFEMPFKVFVLNIKFGYGGGSTLDQTNTLIKVENEFYELYSKYPGPDNTLDLQKALKQEPKNQTLIKFAEFDKHSKIELNANYKEFYKYANDKI